MRCIDRHCSGACNIQSSSTIISSSLMEALDDKPAVTCKYDDRQQLNTLPHQRLGQSLGFRVCLMLSIILDSFGKTVGAGYSTQGLALTLRETACKLKSNCVSRLAVGVKQTSQVLNIKR